MRSGTGVEQSVFSVIMSRRSVRQFEDRDIPDEALIEAIRCATWAPSAHNEQPWEFIVVKDRSTLSLLSKRRWGRFLERTPAAVVVCARMKHVNAESGKGKTNDHSEAWLRRQKLIWESTAAAIQNMLLASRGLGLGTCWIGDFDKDLIKRTLKLPDDISPVAVIAFGYPKSVVRAPERRPLDEVIHWEVFGNTRGVHGE